MENEVLQLIKDCENYIKRNGIDSNVINAYYETCRMAADSEDVNLFKESTNNAKKMMQTACANEFGVDIWSVERLLQDRGGFYGLLDNYYEMLKLETPYVFESFMLHMEKKRYYKERFYQPRENPLRQVAQLVQDLYDDKLDEGMIFCPGRIGKAEPLDALVLTENGFKQMGEIKVGDKVVTANGTICNVAGVFPQGVKDVYRVNFTDETSVECCKEHLWRVQTQEDRQIRPDRGKLTQTYRVVETQEMIGHLKDSKGDNRYSIDYVEPVQFPKKELRIHPYVLGVLIGDGSLTSGNCAICNPEKDVIEKIKELCNGYAQISSYKSLGKCPRYSLVGERVRKDLRFYGLLEKRSYEKSIPFDYLHSDVKDRIELLRGLCDTDGSVCLNSTFVDYSTSSERLANDIIYLVRSLGGRAALSISDSHYIKNGKKFECRKRYRVTFSLNGKIVPVSSKKHLLRYKNNKKVTKKFITSIEFSRRAECQCIMVDDPSHLYVTNDFVVTHNTQIVKFGNLWFGSNRPERSNLYSAYSDKITGGFYDGTIELITDPVYTYAELYPKNVEKKLITDGKDLTIDIIRKKTYPTFTMRSIYGTLNGACDCDGLGIYDDLFSGIDEALSEERQTTVWGKFDNNYIPRIKPGKAKLIGIGTRWAPRDVQGRRLELLQFDPEYADVRHREVIIPALDENGESNFDYPYKLGYSTLDYKRRMASFENNDDIASWLAQYQQQPIERRGQAFNIDNMNFFNPAEIEGIRPDRIFAAVDPAYGGGDFVSAPICYEIGGVYYVTDAVYNDGDKEVTIPELTSRVEKHLDKFDNKTMEVHFEETKTTEEYRKKCEEIWEKDGYPVNATHDPADNQIAKKDRIKNHAPDIRKLCFVALKHQSKEYRKYFQNILAFTYDGKMKHDDGIDSTAQLCDMIYGNKKRTAKAEAAPNPLRWGYGYGY